MEVLIVLLVSFVALRGVGFLGVKQLASWRNAGLGALAVMFLFTSTAHFSGIKHDLVAVFPANVNAALNGIPLGGEAPTPLWLRAPMQLLFIGMLWWTSIKARHEKARPPRIEEPVAEREHASREGAAS